MGRSGHGPSLSGWLYSIYSSLEKPDEGSSDYFEFPIPASSFGVRDIGGADRGPLPSVLVIKRSPSKDELEVA